MFTALLLDPRGCCARSILPERGAPRPRYRERARQEPKTPSLRHMVTRAVWGSAGISVEAWRARPTVVSVRRVNQYGVSNFLRTSSSKFVAPPRTISLSRRSRQVGAESPPNGPQETMTVSVPAGPSIGIVAVAFAKPERRTRPPGGRHRSAVRSTLDSNCLRDRSGG